MHNVLIYGPPGVGKLTVARALADITGFKLADNHLTIDWARRFFDFGTEPFWRLESRLRQTLVDEAIAADLSIISTFLSPNQAVMAAVTPVCARIESLGGHCCFVQLTCAREALEARVVSAERAAVGKLASIRGLQRVLEGADLLAPIPGRDDLIIDNTDLPPGAAAQRIVQHFGLPNVSRATSAGDP